MKKFVVAGEPFTAQCTAYGLPAITISWTFNDEVVEETVPIDFPYNPETNSIKATIQIAAVTFSDDGIYVCIHSAESALASSIILDVYGS